MTDAIAQFNIQFDAIEDRLQLRVLSTDDTEVRIWLTRRYVRLLLNALKQQVSSESKEELQAWERGSGHGHDAMGFDVSSEVQFDEEYKATEETRLPLGEEPILVTRIACRASDSGNLVLVLGQEHEGGMQMEMNLSDELVLSLVKMLLEASNSAEWNLGIKPINTAFTDQIRGAVLH